MRRGSSVDRVSFKRSRVSAAQLTWVWIPATAKSGCGNIVEKNKIAILAVAPKNKIAKIRVRIWKKGSTRDLVSQHVKKLCLQSQVWYRRWKLLLSHRKVNLIKTWRRSNISVKLKQTVRSTIAKKLITQLVPVQLTNQTFSRTNSALPRYRSVIFLSQCWGLLHY